MMIESLYLRRPFDCNIVSHETRTFRRLQSFGVCEIALSLSTLNRKFLKTFLILAFSIAWVLFLVPLAFKDADPQLYQIIITVFFALAMWTPGIAAIVAAKKADDSLAALNIKTWGPKRYYLWAWLLFPILSLLTGVVTVLCRVAAFHPELSLIRNLLAALPETVALNPMMILTLQIGAAILIAPLINMVLMMVVLTVLVGIILSWLCLKTNSPWAPALAHGSMNAIAGISLMFLSPGFDVAISGTSASEWGGFP